MSKHINKFQEWHQKIWYHFQKKRMDTYLLNKIIYGHLLKKNNCKKQVAIYDGINSTKEWRKGVKKELKEKLNNKYYVIF